MALKKNDSLKNLKDIINSDSRHRLITFVDESEPAEIVNLLEKYIAEHNTMKDLQDKEKYIENFLFIVSTVLLKSKNEKSENEMQPKTKIFSKTFYEKVKNLIIKSSPPISYDTQF